MRFGESWPNKHDLSSLRLLGSVGEPINPEAWKWYHRVIGKEKCPIIDTWWQTETGMFMITPTLLCRSSRVLARVLSSVRKPRSWTNRAIPSLTIPKAISDPAQPVARDAAHHLRRR
jgi:hypothetical protein